MFGHTKALLLKKVTRNSQNSCPAEIDPSYMGNIYDNIYMGNNFLIQQLNKLSTYGCFKCMDVRKTLKLLSCSACATMCAYIPNFNRSKERNSNIFKKIVLKYST